MKSKFVLATALSVVAAIVSNLHAAGSITGQGRFEKIAGNPSAGYKYLYEWDLYLSPADNSFTGPSRRLGAPPGQVPTGDGYYRIDNVPAGTYSVYVSQPDFFVSPKVVPNVEIKDGQTTTLNVDLDVDYSTYFSVGGQWTDWGPWDWYQTFLATGTSVRGVSWKMAGSGLYKNKTAKVRILEDNGQPNVRDWKQVGYGTDGNLGADSDEWIRWNSGEVPLTPGKMYAVDIHIDGGLAIYKRDKDGQSYGQGRAYDQDGNAKNFDLNITVFVDKNNQAVTHTRRNSGPGSFDGSLNSTKWGQTFVATGTSLAAVDLFAASGQADQRPTWTVRRNGPGGPQIGPTKTVYGAYFASSTDLLGVSYNPGDVPLTPGETYYIEVTNTAGFTPYTQESWNAYDDGNAWKNGVSTTHDLAMTIIEYDHVVYEPVGFAGYWAFDEVADFFTPDGSGNGHAGTLVNMADGPVDGKVAGALEFDGVDDYVEVEGYKGVAGSHSRTCAAWIRADEGLDRTRAIMSWGNDNTGGSWHIALDNDGRGYAGAIRVMVVGGTITGTTDLRDNEWHHVAVVVDDDNGADVSEAVLYVDGVAEEIGYVSPCAIDTGGSAGGVAANDVRIGAFYRPGRELFFDGLIDEVVIFDEALSAEQVRHLFTQSAEVFLRACGDTKLDKQFRIAGDIDKDCNVDLGDLSLMAGDWLRSGILAGDIFADHIVDLADVVVLAEDWLRSVAPGLVLQFKFDESAGAIAYDGSPNAYDGTIVNADDTAHVEGRDGKALSFDGVDDFVRVEGFKGILGAASRTVCAWIKTSASGSADIVFWGDDRTNYTKWKFFAKGNWNGELSVGIGAGNVIGTTNVCDSEWHHVAAVFANDGTPDVAEVRLYVDGVEEAISRSKSAVVDTLAYSDVLTGSNGTTYFDGLIDEVRIYDRALSPVEIAEMAL